MHSITRLQPENIPENYTDFRQTEEFARYMEKIGWKSVQQGGSFGFVLLLPGLFIAKYLCFAPEPDIEALKQYYPRRHGVVIWRPWNTPQATPLVYRWKRLWKGLQTHSNGNGFSIVTDNYELSWSPRARRNLRTFTRSNGCVAEESFESFSKGMLESTLRPSLQREFLTYLETLTGCFPIHYFVSKDKLGYLGGLAVATYKSTSIHLSAFNTIRGNNVHAGTGLINAWYQNALVEGARYLNFDNISQPGDPKAWSGFSEFKRNFIQYEVTLSAERVLFV